MVLICYSSQFSGFSFQGARPLFLNVKEEADKRVERLFGDTIPNLVGNVAEAPGELLEDGVGPATKEAGHAVRHLMEGVGGAAAEVVKVPIQVADSVATVVGTVAYEGSKIVTEPLVDAPVHLVHGEVAEAGKSVLHGIFVRPFRLAGRGILNTAKKSVETIGTTVTSAVTGVGKLLGVNRKGATGSGILGAVGDLYHGVTRLFGSVGKTKLGQAAKPDLNGRSSSLMTWARSAKVVGNEPVKKAAHGGAHGGHEASEGHGTDHSPATHVPAATALGAAAAVPAVHDAAHGHGATPGHAPAAKEAHTTPAAKSHEKPKAHDKAIAASGEDAHAKDEKHITTTKTEMHEVKQADAHAPKPAATPGPATAPAAGHGAPAAPAAGHATPAAGHH